MKRTPINPSSWGANFQMDQAVLVEQAKRTLYCSGQTAMVEDPSAAMGIGVNGALDMPSQLTATLRALDELLEQAGMDHSNIVHLTIYTTDKDALLAAYGAYSEWIIPSGVNPPQTLVEVAGLVTPELLVEIDMVAAD